MSNSGFRQFMGAIVTLVALLILLAPAQVHATWTIQPPDLPKNFTNMLSRSIAIDPATDRPHIVYGSDHLYHAYYNGSSWVIETVDDSPGVGDYAAVAIDSSGKLHIGYYDSTNNDLKYATNSLGNWVCVTLDSGIVGLYSSIAVDSSDKVHISYRDNLNQDLKYISNSSGSWVSATVDSVGNMGNYSSIAVDSLNKAHISYYDASNGGMRYATNSSGAWVFSEVDASGGTYTSIAVDSLNKIHISYGGAGLKYATNSSGFWATATVDNTGSVGNYNSIVVDSSRKAHISYFDQTNVDLKYATNSSGSWVASAVDGSGGTGNVGQHTSIAIDSADKLHISYYDILNKGLKYTTNTSGSWIKATVDYTGSVGEYTSIAVDSSNKIHISYYDSNNGSDGNLKYATNVSGSWVTTTVDSTGDVGQYTSIALDSNGKVHISYYDVTNANLKYANNILGSWAITTISSTNDSGKHTSIALDSSNKVHISYYYYDGASTTALRYATNSSGGWVVSAIESGTSMGWYTSIAVDTSNKVHISYCDLAAAAFDLKYTTNASGSWVITTVDSAAKVTMQTAIALDSTGRAHIAYYDSALNYDLKYATNASGSWVLTTVDSSGDVGQNASLAIDSSNKAHISYYDLTNLSLKYTNNVYGSWSTSTIDEAGYVGQYSSIARDSSNKVHISYYDATNKDLKYITNAPIDVTPPTGTITIKGGAVYSTSTSVALSLTCGDLQSSCSQMQFSNDNASWSTPQAYAATLAAWTLSSGDGSKTVYARFKDSSGNWSDPVSDTIVLDGTAPTGTTSINSGATLTNSATVSMSLTCSDATSGCDLMRFSNDNATWTVYAYTTTMPWTLSAGDGAKNVYVQFHDTAGNWSGSVSKSITLDSTAPTGTVLFNPNSSYATAKDVSLSLTCTDATSGCSQMRFSNNGTSWSPAAGYASGYSWDLNNVSYGGTAADGSKTVYVQFRDTAGNWSSQIINRAITLDTVKPAGTLQINGGDSYAVAKDVTLGLTCSDATSGCSQMRFSNNGTLWSAGVAFTTSQAWDLHNPTYGGSATDGVKAVFYQFQDTAGNWSVATSSAITFDTTAPIGTLQINSNASYTTAADVTLSLTCGDATSGCSQMRFSNNGASWSPATGFTASFLWDITNAAYGGSPGDGTKTVYVQYQDAAGSWSTSVTKTISLDSAVPSGSVQFNPAGAYTTTKDVTLALTCADGSGSGCSQMRFSNDGTTWSPATVFAAGYPWDLNNASYGGGSADGSKTVFVQFRDAAGSWSSTILKTNSILDRVAPNGSITINSSAIYTAGTNVTLALSCSDATSGCATMEFSNDGGSWSPPEPFGASKNWSLTALDGTRSVAVRLTDNAGKSQVYSSAIILDRTPPGSTATPDGSGSQANAFTVTLACSDGSGSGCAATYYTLDGSIPTTFSSTYSGTPIPVSGLVSPVTLRFFSVDNLGNVESHRSETYNFVAGYSTLTLDLASPTLLQNGLLDISGKLTRYPDSEALPNNGMDLSGLAVSLTVTGPAGSPCENGCSENTATYSSLGHYRFQEIDRFSFKGTYTIQAHFAGTGLHQAANSAAESLLVGASAGYAILVEGKVSSEEGLESHNKTTGRIYDTLKERGFVDDNIMYFNYAGSIVPGVDAVPTKSAIQSAIEEWAQARMNGAPAPLYVIFVDHGNRNTFYIDPDTITPAELNGWLATLESGLGASAMLEKRIVILGACYSGSFLTTLKQAPAELNAGRVIIASAAEDEQSYKGPNEPDGIRSGEFFMEELFKQLKMGASLKAAFVEAAALTRTFTSQGSASANAGNGYGDTSVQHPLLDDDGDGSGSNTLVDGLGDGIESARLHLGFGVTNAALGPADLKAVAATHYLDSASSSTPTPLWSEAYSNAAVSSAWFEVKAPATLLVGTGGTGQLSLDIPKALMQLKQTGRWEPVAGSEPTFNNAGKYEVYYFTKSTNAEISEMKRSLVYKNYPGNLLPAPFNLVSPGAGGVTEKTRTELNLVWEGSSDPDGLTYTVQIATDNLFTNIVFQKEELGTTGYFVDESAGLSDKTVFYWRVQAVDTFGALQPSGQVGSFETDNTNALPGWIKGYVYNGSAVAVAGATVTARIGESIVAQAITISGGAFVMVVPPGSYSVSASAAGYTDGSTGTFDMPSGEIHSIPAITLNAAQSTLQISVSGSGRVYQNPAGLDCSSSDPLTPGCHATVTNGSSISLIADASDWQYLFSAWSGITCGNDSSNTATLCTFSVNADANITASFGPNYQARTSTGQGFSSLQLALNSAATATTVQARAYTFQEAILLNRLDDAVLTVDGGCWGADYTPSAGGYTTINGLVTIQRGTLKISGPLAVR